MSMVWKFQPKNETYLCTSNNNNPDTHHSHTMKNTSLISKIKTLDALTAEEKAELIALLNNTKKYGLVWEDKPEDVEELLRTQLLKRSILK